LTNILEDYIDCLFLGLAVHGDDKIVVARVVTAYTGVTFCIIITQLVNLLYEFFGFFL
jgi:hypothetical protein